MENHKKMGSNFENAQKKKNLNKTLIKILFIKSIVSKYLTKASIILLRYGIIEIFGFY